MSRKGRCRQRGETRHNVPQAVDGARTSTPLALSCSAALRPFPDQDKNAWRLREVNESRPWAQPTLCCVLPTIPTSASRTWPSWQMICAVILRTCPCESPQSEIRKNVGVVSAAAAGARTQAWYDYSHGTGRSLFASNLVLQKTEQVQTLLNDARHEANGDWPLPFAACNKLKHRPAFFPSRMFW